MLESNDRSNRDFSRFDELSTSELENIIRQDSMLEDDEDSDIDAILYITDILARRREEENNGNVEDVEAAWQSFKENYYPYRDDPTPLFSFDTDEETQDEPAPVKVRRPFLKRLIKPISIAAVFVFILVAGTATAYALGFDLWGTFASWTHETFRFAGGKVTEVTQPFEKLRDALGAYEIEGQFVPNWLPDEYTEDIVQVSETPNGIYLSSRCQCGSEEISIEIKSYVDPDFIHTTYEKFDDEEDEVEIILLNEIEHYITQNGDLTRISWINGSNECSILCEFGEEEIHRMINSVYER